MLVPSISMVYGYRFQHLRTKRSQCRFGVLPTAYVRDILSTVTVFTAQG